MARMWVALAGMGIAGASVAAETPPPPPPMKPGITIAVDLEHYNVEPNTYSGGVTVSARPCPNVTYNTRIDFAGAKNAADARKKTAPTVARLVDNIRRAAANQCR